MANDNNDNNQDSNNNNNNNNDSPLQPRRNLLLEAFNSIRTPLQNRSRIDWQELIDWQHHQQQDILNFDANIGLTTTLFDEKEKKEEEEKEEVERAEEEEGAENEKEEGAENEKGKDESIMTTTTYKIGGVEIAFDNATPTQTHRLRWLYDL